LAKNIRYVRSLLAHALAFVMAAALAAAAIASPVTSVRELPTGLELQTDTGDLTVEPWSESIVHVRFGPAGYRGNYNPSVIAAPGKVHFDIRQTADAYILATSKLTARISKATAAVSFTDARGKVLLQEAERSIGSGTVQAFATRTPIFGLGQHVDGLLDYSGSTVHLQQKNGDVAIPMMLSPNGFGVLWNNASVMDVDVAKPDEKRALVVRNEAGAGIDYHFILGPAPDQVIAGYRWLTGDAPLMPKWSWGFWQSREHYETQDQVLGVARTYRAMGVPIDAVVIDWQHWRPGDWGAHKFDPARFPDPAGMVRALHQLNVHVPVSVWARFDPDTANTKELEAAGGLFPPTYNNVYPPGKGRWYDAWNPNARQIYWDQIRRGYGVLGFDTWWLDASEAELGGNWGQMRELRTAGGPGAEVYNSYPLLHTTAVHDGMRRDMPDKRVMILTRSAYAGQQRNGALTWSGDTQGTWDSFRKNVTAALNFSMSGIPYWSADIGGFFGGDTHDRDYAELFNRWEQFAIFTPQFRVHGTNGGKEIWNWNGDVQPQLIENVKLRYRLLPYIYSLAWDVTKHRGTMMRALLFDYRSDPKAVAQADEYMFGKALLVAPVVEKGARARKVYLPAGTSWFDFFGGRRFAGGQTIEAEAPTSHIPLFAPAGSIVPIGPVKPYADALSNEPIELRVYPGASGSFELYDDAGEGFGYEKDEYSLVGLAWNDRTGSFSFARRIGAFPGMARRQQFKIVCGSAAAASRLVSYSGDALSVKLPDCR
jgi:alpha-D-xyloside xylohydrolase